MTADTPAAGGDGTPSRKRRDRIVRCCLLVISACLTGMLILTYPILALAVPGSLLVLALCLGWTSGERRQRRRARRTEQRREAQINRETAKLTDTNLSLVLSAWSKDRR